MPLLIRSEEHTSELQSPCNLVCRLLLEKKKRHKPAHRSDQLHRAVLRSHAGGARPPSPRRGPAADRAHLAHTPLQAPVFFVFFNDTATTEIYTLSLHDALPICSLSPHIVLLEAGAKFDLAKVEFP